MRGRVLMAGELWVFVHKSHGLGDAGGGSEAGVWSSRLHVLKLTVCKQQSGSEYWFWCLDQNPC